jgi:hypothetical protein
MLERQMLERRRKWEKHPLTTFWDRQELALHESEVEALVGSGKEETKK